MTTFCVDVNFSSPNTREFTERDYRWFGNGDIEQGKRNVDAAIQRLADRIDQWCTEWINEGIEVMHD